jgi:hypothetical protein
MVRKAAVERCVRKLQPYLGRAAGSLDQLLQVTREDGLANLGVVLRTLYPNLEQERALASLRQFRLALNRCAKKAGIAFRLSGDTKTRSAPEHRSVWFEGEDPLANEIEEFNRPNIAGPNRSSQSAIQLEPKLLYVVYAAEDKKEAEKLLRALEPHLKNADLDVWHRGKLLPGEVKSEEREKARKKCVLTLHFLSPEFFAGKLQEDKSGRIFPVLPHELAAHTKQPDGRTVFTANGKSFAKGKPSDFALGLIEAIQAVLEKPDRGLDAGFEQLARHHARYIASPASAPLSLAQELEAAQASENRCDALHLLQEWLLDPKAPPYCALFGELGMGKTTNMQPSDLSWTRSSSIF